MGGNKVRMYKGRCVGEMRSGGGGHRTTLRGPGGHLWTPLLLKKVGTASWRRWGDPKRDARGSSIILSKIPCI
eukprot:SAG11_NODE_16484_length_546_cov_0.827740_1_plen_73_part_00